MSDWRFEVEEVSDGPDDERVERGSPSPENVFFVLLGAAVTLGIVAMLLL